MGGLNFVTPTDEAVGVALEEVWADYPDAVVLDGTDDWLAPEWVRPELFPELFGIEVIALWHTGASGKSASGLVLSPDWYAALDERYEEHYGVAIEAVPSQRTDGSHSACGCWDGDAFRVYRSDF